MSAVARTLRAYPALLRVGFAGALAYRAEMIVWMLTTTMPLVSLALWNAVAEDGPVGRFDQRGFGAYFLATLVVRQLTGSWLVWELNMEIRSGSLVLLLEVLKSVADMVGVASIVPFLGVLGNPEFVSTNRYAAAVYHGLGFSSVDSFLFALGVCVIVILLATSALRSAATYASNRWMAMRGHSLGRRLLESYMRQPYVFFLDQHNAYLATNVLNETQRVVSSVYRPLADLISSGLTFALIVGLLLWVDPVVTLASVAVLGGLYYLLFLALRPQIRRLADQTAVATYDIEQIVREIQSAVSAGVMGMDKFSEEVRRGMSEVTQVGDQLSQIIGQVQSLAPRVQMVNEGMQAQAGGAEQINQALMQLSEAAQQTVESLRQSSQAIDELTLVSNELRSGVSRFKV